MKKLEQDIATQGETVQFLIPGWLLDRWDRTRRTDFNPCVYRLYSADGELLYIGQSISLLARMQQHRQFSWFKDIATITVEHQDSQEAAREAERLAIESEKPQHNIDHTGKRDYVAAAQKGQRTRIANEIKADTFRLYPKDVRLALRHLQSQLRFRYYTGELAIIESDTRIDLIEMAKIISDRWDEVDLKKAQQLYRHLLEKENRHSLMHTVKAPGTPQGRAAARRRALQGKVE